MCHDITVPFSDSKPRKGRTSFSPIIGDFEPHGQKLEKVVNFGTRTGYHGDVIIFEKK